MLSVLLICYTNPFARSFLSPLPSSSPSRLSLFACTLASLQSQRRKCGQRRYHAERLSREKHSEEEIARQRSDRIARLSGRMTSTPSPPSPCPWCAGSSWQQQQRQYCAPGCPDNWLADRMCDQVRQGARTGGQAYREACAEEGWRHWKGLQERWCIRQTSVPTSLSCRAHLPPPMLTSVSAHTTELSPGVAYSHGCVPPTWFFVLL